MPYIPDVEATGLGAMVVAMRNHTTNFGSISADSYMALPALN